MRLRNERHSIFSRMLGTYLICNTLLLVLFGAAMMTSFSYSMKREVRRYNEIISEQMKYRFDSIYENIISSMVQFSSFEEVTTALAKRSMDGVDTMQMNRLINKYLKRTESSIISDMMVVGINGYSYSYMTGNRLKKDYDYWEQEWFREAVNDEDQNQYIHVVGLHEQDYYNEMVAQPALGGETFSISFALTNEDQKVIGALFYNFNVDKVGEILNSNNYENNYRLALVDDDGTIMSVNEGNLTGEKLKLDRDSWEKISDEESGTIMAPYDGVKSMINFQTTNMGWKLISTVPVSSIDAHTTPIWFLFGLLLIICLLANGVIVLRISKSLHRPISSLVNSIQNIDFNHLKVNEEIYEYDEMNLIHDRFNDVILRLDDYIKKDLKSQLLLNKFRLDSLQAQINPHFLMNTLQLLQTEIVCGNVRESNDMIVSLSRMLNYSLYDKSSMVRVREELNYIQAYLNLFRMKYEDRLQIEYDIQEKVQDYFMPKLLLQPLVENCIKHAFGENPNHAVIRISVKEEDRKLVFRIRDNGIGMKKEILDVVKKGMEEIEIDSSEIGVKNVHQRIQVLFGDAYGVQITSKYGKGTEVHLEIPEITQDQLPEYEEKSDEITNRG
ncbi:MAG TPA: sensor histidine kinase [Candidatus Pullilachnospira intestinigallinarum]|nr:sensor histidine kinase [Candidatus Pullilachnospira intestinigallinarum]